MSRMTPELLLSSHSYLNPLADRELDLRGYQIPAIENLGVTKDSLDSIDLTDNSIRSLINFPKMKRLKHLYVSNNPLTLISPNLPQALPNLNSLVLSNCNLSTFNQLFLILKQFTRLEFLVLTGNPVCKVKLYRDWCIYNCPKVRMLDFKRVKDKERKTSTELFYDPVSKGPTAIAQALSIAEENSNDLIEDSTMASATYRANQKVEPGQSGRTLTSEERERIKRSIEEAASVEEVRRLKRMLEQGFIPRDDRKTIVSTATSGIDSNNDTENNPDLKEPTSEQIKEQAPSVQEKNQDVEMTNGENKDHEKERNGDDQVAEPTVPVPTKKRESNKSAKSTKPKLPARATRSKTGNGNND